MTRARLMIGDVRKRIAEIPDGSVDAIITSPPFLALRKYGDNADAEMGSEPTPAAFLDALLELTAEFRRVLAPHGSIAVELGDTYSGSGGAGGDYSEGELRDGQERFRQARVSPDYRPNQAAGKCGDAGGGLVRVAGGPGWPDAKSLCLTPFAYPMALAYGHNPLTGQPSPAGRWRVRNMIAWCRPNPPVGALGDKVRPATSYITVACTGGRRWFDLDAVRTAHQDPEDATRSRIGKRNIVRAQVGLSSLSEGGISNPAGAPPLDWWEDDYDTDDLGHLALIQATQPYSGAHYAVWPKSLAKKLILMMCPPGGTVLDPFAGSGTTLAVATGCGRDAIGIELYDSHADLIRDRCGMFLEEIA